MTENDTIRQMQQDTLNFILAELKSDEPGRQLEAIERLGTILFSSGAIIVQLEKLVLEKNAEVRAAALGALELKTSQIVTSNMSRVVKANRQIILAEIKDWEQDGLIESHQAEIIQRRYDFDIRPGLASIFQPTLILWGEKDPIAPLRDAEYLKNKLPQATLTILEGCGHSPMREQPARFDREVGKFLQAEELGSSR